MTRGPLVLLRLLGVLLLVLTPALPLSAQEAGLPPELKLPLLIKVLSFDRGLEDRHGDAVVAIVYQRQVPGSVRERDVWLEAARTPLHLRGARVRVVAIDYRSADQLVHSLREAHATVVFLSSLRAVDVPALAEDVRVAGFRTATDTPAVASRAASIGLLLRSGRPHIVINMPLALREGSDFSSQLLRVAEVVK